ncbi:MAG: hypothetical protein JSR61_18110 [Proteobacteria bacterium]|nr:hypothetical protein [Pseudomonadota bacterium]
MQVAPADALEPPGTPVLSFAAMNGQDPSSSEPDSRVVTFPQGRIAVRPSGKTAEPKTFAKYEGGREKASEYRHRMITNAAALAFVALLVAAGLWLADTMASMRKNQDCVLTGRRGCSPVEIPVRSRY